MTHSNIEDYLKENQKLMEELNRANLEKEKLDNEIARLKHENNELNQKIEFILEQLRLGKSKTFGRSSDTSVCEQLSFPIFNEAEMEYDSNTSEEKETIVYTRNKKKKGHREEMFENLPVETIEYVLPEEEQFCDKCNCKLHVMSKETRREVVIIPAKVKLKEHVRYIYSCRCCEKKDTEATIKKASMPNPALPNSFASASAIAYVMCEKFVKGLPLYCQEQDWARLGFKISRQTMSNWMVLSSDRWLKPLYERMREYLIQRDILHVDETTLQVLHEPGRPASTKSYMWLYRTGREGPHIVLFNYQMTRAGKHPREFLDGYKGYLSTDGYSGYNDMPGIINVGCLAHAQRMFTNVIKAMPPNNDSKSSLAEEGLRFFTQLFAIEKAIEELSNEERYRIRQEKSRPIIEEFKKWINYHYPRVLPKSTLGKAIAYCKNQMPKLEGFLLDGRLEMTNNRAERSIRPFTIGRKNWIFSNTPSGANSSAIIYSMVETSKENGLNPYLYLEYLFDKLPNVDLGDKEMLDEFLPWSDNLPEFLKA